MCTSCYFPIPPPLLATSVHLAQFVDVTYNRLDKSEVAIVYCSEE